MNQYVSQGVFDRRVKLIEEKLKNIYDNDLLNRLQAEQEEFIKRLKEIELDGSIPDYFIADYNAFKANTLRIDSAFDSDGQFDGSRIQPNTVSTAALTVGQRSQQLSLTGVEFSVTPYSHSGGYYGTLGWSDGSMFHYGFINKNSEPKVYTITRGSFALGNSAYYIYAYIANLESTTTTAEIKVSTNQIKVDGEGKPNDFPNGYYVQLGYVSVELDSGSSELSNRYYRKVDTTYGQTTINGRLITTGRIEGGGNDAAYFDLDKGEIGGKIIFKSGNNTYNTIDSYLQSKYNDILSYVDTNSSFVDAIGNLQDQIDGTIATWFYDYEPTLLLPPVANNTNPNDDWSTTKIKINHLGDLFYNTSTGYCYRFANVGTSENPSFKWSRVTDVDVVKALDDAAKAQDTADHKRRVFITNENELPPVPYDVGDLWSNATYANGGVTYYINCLLRCKTARASGATANISDWQDSSRATETADLSLAQVEAAKSELLAIENGTTTIAGGMITNNLLELKNIVGVSKQFKSYVSGRQYYKRISNVTSGGSTVARFLTVSTGSTYPNYNLYEEAEHGDINTISGIAVSSESQTTGTSKIFKGTEFYYGGGTPGFVTAGLSGIEDFPCYWSGGDEVLARNYINFKKAWDAAPSPYNASLKDYEWDKSNKDFIYDYDEVEPDHNGHPNKTFPVWKKESTNPVKHIKANFITALSRYEKYIRNATKYAGENSDWTTIDSSSDIPRLPVVIIDSKGFCKFGDFYIYESQVYYNNASGFGHYSLTLNGATNGSGTSLGSFYAPTGAGTNGYILKSNGSGAPSWLQTLPVANGGTGNTTGTAKTLVGSYIIDGDQQNPNYFGVNKVGALMMNTTVNGNSQYKDWLFMDCYSGNNVGGGVAFGVNRQSLGAYIMRSAAARTSWAESAELIGTHNYTTYTVKKDGTGASGTWGISISGNAATATILQTTRTINGTNFNGSANITTSTWGTARNISISDADGTNTGTAISVNGSENKTLKLPSTIKASLNGTVNGYSISSTVNSGAANRLAYYTSNGIDDASTIYASNTKLAINSTTEPSQNLYVDGTSYLNGVTEIPNLLYINDYIRLGQGGNTIDGYRKSTSAFVNLHLNYYSNGNTTLSYGGGNVGIGTNSPAYKLDVNGTSFFNSTMKVTSTGTNRATFELISNGDYPIDLKLGRSNTAKWSLTSRNNSEGDAFYLYSYVQQAAAICVKNDSTLRVGIGTTSPSSQCKLHVDGNIYATGGVTALQAVSSDKRLKKNIKKFKAKDIIDKLNPVSFEWNSKAKKLSDFKDGTNYGLIAQDSDGIIDNLVFDLPDGKGYKGVRYEKLIPILLQAVKEQQKEIDELKKLVKK